MKLAKCLAILLALAVSAGCAQLLLAQGTDLGTIRGTVTDPAAQWFQMQARHPGSGYGYVREPNTNPQGEYQIFGLPPGTYKVSIAAPGMDGSKCTGSSDG